MNMNDRMREQGYSKEEEYFFRKDRELLARLREEADARRQALEEEHRGQAYWMVCPKCGGRLQEENLEHVVRVDRCVACGGVYFDAGELDLFMKSKRP